MPPDSFTAIASLPIISLDTTATTVGFAHSLFFTLGMINGKYKKDRKEAKRYLQKVIEINPSRFMEMQNFICNFDSLLVY